MWSIYTNQMLCAVPPVPITSGNSALVELKVIGI